MAIAAAAAGVVLGFVLGGFGPRRQLAEAEREVARLQAEQQRGGGTWRSPVPGLDRILTSPERDSTETGGDEKDEERPLAEADPTEDAPAVAADGGVARRGWRERWRRGGREGAAERYSAFERAASVQRVRRVQSRAALVQQGPLEGEEQVELDQLLGEMNDSLAEYGEEILMLASRDQPPQPRDLLGITHDVTGVLAQAQQRLESLLGPERAAAVEPTALEIWNHVDLDRLEPAARAELTRRRR